MSINLPVNPVNIKKGFIITTDSDTVKKDFDKRRLLRLEQVRYQSKQMTEVIRNKVQREKDKQIYQIEKEGKEKLKNWQNLKLLEVQNDYLDALDEIGRAHKEAEELADENEIIENVRLRNEEIAKSRGQLAETKLQAQKKEDDYKKNMEIRRRNLVRDIENTRAALVRSMKKPQPKKIKKRNVKKKHSIHVILPNESDFSKSCANSDSFKDLPSTQEEDTECSNGSEDAPAEETPLTETDQQGGFLIKPIILKPETQNKSYRESIKTRPIWTPEDLKNEKEKIDDRLARLLRFYC